jgi:hypothetical protein
MSSTICEVSIIDINWVDKECKRVEYFTPENILDCTRYYFGGPIPLDPATTGTNPTKAERFYTLADNGLAQPWDRGVFVNPPYGRVIKDWTKKICEASELGTQIIALLPCGARFSTRYWQDNILSSRLNVVCFVRGRVNFLDEFGNKITRINKHGKKVISGNPYDSAIYGYNVFPDSFVESFGRLGKILRIEVAR